MVMQWASIIMVKLRSAELLLHEDGSVELIRRAETIEDYFATLYYDGSVLKKIIDNK